MLQAFIIVLREGFEAFLIVAVMLAYLRKTGRPKLLPAIYWGTAASIFASGTLGFILLAQANEALWEGIFGLIAAVLVSWLVIHMWRTAPYLKREMEQNLEKVTLGKPTKAAFLGVFFFTLLMITREGMETALLLIQIHDPKIVTGIFLGILAAVGMAVLWIRFSHLINLKAFFQVTSVFLLLFVAQILIYSLHEFSEAGLLPHSEELHLATEPFSPDGYYGKWFTFIMVAGCAVWLLGAALFSRNEPRPKAAH